MSSRPWKIAAAGILIAASSGLAVAHAESNPMQHPGPGVMNGTGMMKKMGGMMPAAIHFMPDHLGPMHPQEN